MHKTINAVISEETRIKCGASAPGDVCSPFSGAVVEWLESEDSELIC